MPASGPFDIGAECRYLAEQFGEVAGGGAPTDPGIVPGNIVVLLPYALCHGLPFDGAADAARTMALGNVFGAAHFLLQDRWLDGDESIGPSSAGLSDRCLSRFLRAYVGLFPPESRFWSHLDRYTGEYFGSLEWERDVLRSREGARAVGEARLDETLTLIGRKMSPLKTTVAAVALLSGRVDVLARAERIVEDFHAAYQLADDLDDLASDMGAGRWSAGAWFLSMGCGLGSPGEAGGADALLRAGAECGALGELVELIRSRYARAAGDAGLLDLGILEAYLGRLESRAGRTLGRMARRLALVNAGEADGGNGAGGRNGVGGGRAAAGPGPLLHAGDLPPHSFTAGGESFVYDRGSGLLFEADGTAVDVLSWLRAGAREADLDVVRLNHGAAPVDEALREVSRLTGCSGDSCALGLSCPGVCARRTPAAERWSRGPSASRHPHGPSLTGLSSVALNVAGGCNLACDYCYLGLEDGGPRLMSDEVAHRAIDLLFDESFGESVLSVVFFGGEPLLNAGLIAQAAAYARRRAADDGRCVSFYMTTNGTLLTPDVAAMLRSERVHTLVSLDGAADCHDAQRRFRSGAGSYDTIASNLRGLPAGMRLGARATVTEASAPLSDIVEHLRGLGIGVVHLAPVGGEPMRKVFADRLVCELEELARGELERVRAGKPPSVGCFLEPMVALEVGRQRLAPCGAGERYVSVASDGGLYLCHRFAGDGRYSVGDVAGGLDRFAVGRLLARMAERSSACSDCWALGLCGGACYHDVETVTSSFGGPGSERCRVTRRALDLAMWLYASMPPAGRRRLGERARAAARPEMAVRGGSAPARV